jgi:galactokinase
MKDTNQITRAVEGFERHFRSHPTYISTAPGRVNLIGEHTDYQRGYVFPCAIDLSVTVAISVADDCSEVVSEGFGSTGKFILRDRHSIPSQKWARYALGVGALLREEGTGLPPFSTYAVTDLPSGAGVSSSAAIEIAFANAFLALAGTSLPLLKTAQLAQRAENEICGTPCGILDHLAILHGKAGFASFIDTLAPEVPRHYGLPDSIALVVCDTGEKHDLGASGYPLRRRQTEEAAELLGVDLLRKVDTTMLATRQGRLTEVLYRRARHVVSENARALSFRSALESSDLAELGRLLRESHVSLRDDFEVSTDQLNATADFANSHPACIGARMMGGGFGGSCIALVNSNNIGSFTHDILGHMTKLGNDKFRVYECHACDGAECHEFKPN